MPDYAPLLIRPPYPVTVIEYSVIGQYEPGMEVSSRRIVVAISSETGLLPPFPMAMSDEPPNVPGVWVYSACYFDRVKIWNASLLFMFLPYDSEISTGAHVMPAVLERLQISEAQAKRRNALPVKICGLNPDFLATVGGDEIGRMLADMQFEMSAYVQMCLALGCANVATETIPVAEKHAKARAKAGKPRLHDYHVLMIPGSDGGGEPSGTGRSVRSHLRRGHIRRLGADRMTWVNATMVKGGTRGFVSKDYSVKPDGIS